VPSVVDPCETVEGDKSGDKEPAPPCVGLPAPQRPIRDIQAPVFDLAPDHHEVPTTEDPFGLYPPAAGSNINDITIDGRTGWIVDGVKGAKEQNATLRFQPREFVRIVVLNVNPFLFRYKILIGNEQVIQEASPLDFASLVLGKSSAPSIATTPQVPVGGVEGSPPNYRAGLVAKEGDCGNIDATMVDPLLKRLATLITLHDYIYNNRIGAWSIDPLDNSEYLRLLAAVQVSRDARLEARAVRYQAFLVDSLATDLARKAPIAKAILGSALDGYKIALSQVNSAISDLDAMPPVKDTTSSKCTGLNHLLATVRTYPTDDDRLDADKTETIAERVDERMANVAALATQFAGIWSDASRFWVVSTLSRQDASGDVTVTIERQTIPQAKAPVTPPSQTSDQKQDGTSFAATITGTIGGKPSGAATQQNAISTAGGNGKVAATSGTPKAPAVPDSGFVVIAQPIVHFRSATFITVGIGMFYTPLPAPQFGTQQHRIAAPPGAAADTLVTQVVVTDNSTARFVPGATLAIRLPITPADCAWGFHGVLGATLLPKSSDLAFGLIGGIGISLWQNKVMAVPGVYVSNENYLIGGYHVGDGIPASSSAPVGSHLAAAFTIGLSFRAY
jgi:hypothetical protein